MKTTLAWVLLLLCATALTASAAPPAGSGTWYLYWIDKDGSESYLSMKYYTPKESRVRVFTYIDRPHLGQHTNVVELFDCPTRQVARLTMSDYDASDKEIQRYERDDEIPKFEGLFSRGIDRITTLSNGICSGGIGGKPASASEAARYFSEFEVEVRKIRGH